MADFNLDERERETIALAVSMLIMGLEAQPQHIQVPVIYAVLVALYQLLDSFADDPPEPDPNLLDRAGIERLMEKLREAFEDNEPEAKPGGKVN